MVPACGAGFRNAIRNAIRRMSVPGVSSFLNDCYSYKGTDGPVLPKSVTWDLDRVQRDNNKAQGQGLVCASLCVCACVCVCVSLSVCVCECLRMCVRT